MTAGMVGVSWQAGGMFGWVAVCLVLKLYAQLEYARPALIYVIDS